MDETIGYSDVGIRPLNYNRFDLFKYTIFQKKIGIISLKLSQYSNIFSFYNWYHRQIKLQ